jgi:transcriptional regulator with XRE-family HTH domain
MILKDDDRPNEFTLATGRLIKQAREARRLSQRELADALGRRQASVSDMENGKMEPSASTLVQLAQVLEKPITYFFPKPWGPQVARGDLTYDEQALLLEFRRLRSDEHRRIAIRQVGAIADLYPRD